MGFGYTEALTKCEKCGKSYSRKEFKECPHNFRDKLSRQMMGQEGKGGKRMKIYLTCEPYNWGRDHHDFIGYALGEDGQGLASHLSSTIDFAKHDMGLTSDWKHAHYAKCYPEGYDLEWIDDPAIHESWQKALALNKAMQEANQ